jgi:hypothetical protein
MERGRLPGSSACFAFPPIVARRAGIVSFPSALTGASCPRSRNWAQERSRIPFRISDATPHVLERRQIDFHTAACIILIEKAMEFAA